MRSPRPLPRPPRRAEHERLAGQYLGVAKRHLIGAERTTRCSVAFKELMESNEYLAMAYDHAYQATPGVRGRKSGRLLSAINQVAGYIHEATDGFERSCLRTRAGELSGARRRRR